eukprot:scaffold69310_cov48-Attheya_sp.AAC.6
MRNRRRAGCDPLLTSGFVSVLLLLIQVSVVVDAFQSAVSISSTPSPLLGRTNGAWGLPSKTVSRGNHILYASVDKADMIDPSIASSTELGGVVQLSLASSFLVSIQEGHDSHEEWNLARIPDADSKSRHGVGSLAIDALNKGTTGESTANEITLQTRFTDTHIVVTSTGENQEEVGGSSTHEELISVLQRVMVQRAAKKILETIDKTLNTQVTVILENKTEISCQLESIVRNDCVDLFEACLSEGAIENGVEMVDMVDANGASLGVVPRPLVHKFNLLHRGIGILVSENVHIDQNTPDLGSTRVYVHRRTDTKRIFPSMYDMFVGGVSTAGEDAKLTAQREVAEELGLKRVVGLSSPLFQCTVCTSYNRCVVSMFTYQYDASAGDTIAWQEDEVAWGEFVPYSMVEEAAVLSVDRLRQGQNWPGNSSTILPRKTTLHLSMFGNSDDWKSWDFVPDGLLVWEAWQYWMLEM